VLWSGGVERSYRTHTHPLANTHPHTRVHTVYTHNVGSGIAERRRRKHDIVIFYAPTSNVGRRKRCECVRVCVCVYVHVSACVRVWCVCVYDIVIVYAMTLLYSMHQQATLGGGSIVSVCVYLCVCMCM